MKKLAILVLLQQKIDGSCSYPSEDFLNCEGDV